jgi:hypothetical protein
VGVVPDAGDDTDPQGRNERSAVWSRPGIQDSERFQRACSNRGEAGAAAVGNQDATVVRNDARRSRKALQRREVSVRVSVDHLKAVPIRVRDEHATGIGIEGPVVKGRARCMGDLNGPGCSQ